MLSERALRVGRSVRPPRRHYLTHTLEQRGELLRPLRRRRARGAGERDRADQRPGADRGNGSQLPGLHRHRDHRHAAPTNRCSATAASIPPTTQTLAGQLVREAPQLARLRGGHRRTGARSRARARIPPLGQADPTATQSVEQRALRDLPQPVRVLRTRSLDSPACATDDVGLEQAEGRPGERRRARRASPTSCPTAATTGTRRPARRAPRRGCAPADAFLKTGRSRDHGLEGLQGKRAARDHRRSGAVERRIRRLELLLRSAAVPERAGQDADAGAPRGGGAVGALLLSPYVKGATTSQEPFNHFSLLRTIEDLFGAAAPRLRRRCAAVKSFEPALFTAGKRLSARSPRSQRPASGATPASSR